MSARETVKRYFNKYCSLNPPFHNLEQDQKRLQETFGPTVLLRWNWLAKCCQVWDTDRTGLIYCVMNVDPPYSVAKVISALRTRIQRKGLLREMYENQMAEWDYENEQKIAAATEPTAEAFGMHAVGKVTTSGKGLRSTEKPKDFGAK